jgi:hypothetical protein
MVEKEEIVIPVSEILREKRIREYHAEAQKSIFILCHMLASEINGKER